MYQTNPPALRRQLSVRCVSLAARSRRAMANRQILVASFATIVMIAAIIVIVLQWYHKPDRFPPSAGTPLRIESPGLLEQILPEAPETPTVPGLSIGEPTPLPGLESVAWAKSPTLTEDLLMIVFVTLNPAGSRDDVWIAERDSLADPFPRPVPIANVNSDKNETHPSLSPDGLSLSLIRMSDPPQWYVSQRTSRTEDFPTASLVRTDALIEPPFHIDYVQQITHRSGILSIRDSGLTTSQCCFYRRSKDRLVSIDQLPTADPWPRYFCSANRMRIYFVRGDGLFVAGRASPSSKFLLPEQFLGPELLGGDASRFDSAIWLNKAEDLLVYAAAGTDPQSQQDNSLWMLRLR